MVTISTHNGSTAHREHNIRNEKVVCKQNHIQENGDFEIWKDEEPRAAYQRIFGEALERYNEKQKRPERKIKDYYKHIQKSDKQHPVYEMIIGIYHSDADSETKKQIMKEFVETWQERNPNLELIGAYYHNDEEGEAHCHIDYVPVAHGYTKGLDTQAGLVKALEEMGYSKTGKITAQIKWEKDQNEFLEKLCCQKNISVTHTGSTEHLKTEQYKIKKDNQKLLQENTTLSIINQENRQELKTTRVQIEQQKVVIGEQEKVIQEQQNIIQEQKKFLQEKEIQVEKLNKDINILQKIKEDILKLLNKIMYMKDKVIPNNKENPRIKEIKHYTSKANVELINGQVEESQNSINQAVNIAQASGIELDQEEDLEL